MISAVTTIRRSWQHLAASVALCLAILGWYAARSAPASAFVAVAGIGALLVVHNLRRIARARAALAGPDALASFVTAQRASHRLRRRIYLVSSPVLLLATWLVVLRAAHVPLDARVALWLATSVLAAGWVWWGRPNRNPRSLP